VGGLFGNWGPKKQATLEDEPTHQMNVRRDLSGKKHQYFFAINLYNSFDVIPDIFATLFRVAAILGYSNVYVSIYENGSTDQTKALLRIFDALAQVAGLRVEIRTSMRTRGAFNHRIEYLAEVRNAALVPLHELRENKQIVFDSIVFMNDILPCVDDLLELIWQSRRQNAGITCASDYMFHDDIGSPVFYGTPSPPPCAIISLTRTDNPSLLLDLLQITGSPETSTEPPSRTPPSRTSSTTRSPPAVSRTISRPRSNPAGTESPSSTRHPCTPSLTSASAWPTSPLANAPPRNAPSSATTTPRPATAES
jgi:transcriptional regulator with XRE-family HTH domain